MKIIAGILIVLLCVLGGFVISEGELASLWHPPELLIIGGGAAGAFVIANPMSVIKSVVSELLGLLKGSKYGKPAYMELLAMLFEVFSIARKDGVMALEQHLEEPDKSPLFKKYKVFSQDHAAVEFLTDNLRLVVSGAANSNELEAMMEKELELALEERREAGGALTRISDALPGFGIVAAVMGVVITMMSISDGPEVIGAKVAAALVGTFLGILLAYGFVGPLGHAMEHKAIVESKYLEVIKAGILANINGYSPQMSVEFARKVILEHDRPSFSELEKFLKEKKP
ncbi:MAG: flagellar motor stator protein MotA [Pseudomonadota bacterium]